MLDNPGFVIMITRGSAVQRKYGTLTENAKVIWENYEKVDSLYVMIQRITDKFEVEEELARKDVVSFTYVLLQKGMIGLTKADESW